MLSDNFIMILSGQCTDLAGRCEVCIRSVGFDQARVMDGFTSVGGSLPEVGDVTLCMYCGAFLTFAQGGVFPEAAPEHLDSLDPESLDQMLHLQRTVRERFIDHSGDTTPLDA